MGDLASAATETPEPVAGFLSVDACALGDAGEIRGEMSALGERIAIIGLGFSCQAAAQIRRQVALLRELTGDPSLQESAFPWDWLLMPPPSLAGLLQSPAPFPPADEITLRCNEPELPWWERHQVIYRHSFSDRDRFRIERYDRGKGRHDHASAKLKSLPDRVVGILSNTQNDYPATLARARAGGPFVEAADLWDASRAFRALFGPAAKLAFVTYPELHSGTKVEGVQVVERRRDPRRTSWSGDARAWSDAFREIFAPTARP